jgi:hypothetical protein
MGSDVVAQVKLNFEIMKREKLPCPLHQTNQPKGNTFRCTQPSKLAYKKEK